MNVTQSENFSLYNSSCLEVLQGLTPGSLDSLICDPPYATTSLAWDKPIDWEAFWPLAWRALKPTGVAVMFAAQPFATDLINSQRKMFRYELIWEKNVSTGFLYANHRPMKSHENILVFAPQFKAATYNPQKTVGKPYQTGRSKACPLYEGYKPVATRNTGDRHPRSVLRYANSRPGGKSLHPTQKPLDLMEWLVRTYSNPGEWILDPFTGSGSTGVAALLNGRRFIGVERDESYYDVARERLLACADI